MSLLLPKINNYYISIIIKELNNHSRCYSRTKLTILHKSANTIAQLQLNKVLKSNKNVYLVYFLALIKKIFFNPTNSQRI
jgi:hypothetical protein